ncbi:MAG TPA: carboxypeptidase-like regulatory domain-containing protein [Blastocatellia bacterium]|jgi:hypothetical protein|nr:carboxypeptidase-like regulatory domain-containing protein [Blastocatellia bacterium]
MRFTSFASAIFHTSARVSIIAAAMLASVSAFAQETRSTILGTVKDQSGAIVAGATVDVTNTETNATTKLSTNSSGYFEAPYLLPGVYSITVTAQGFKRYVQQGYTLTVNSRQNIDVTLWDVPETNITSSNFGRVTTQWNTPRFIQFQLRYTF